MGRRGGRNFSLLGIGSEQFADDFNALPFLDNTMIHRVGRRAPRA